MKNSDFPQVFEEALKVLGAPRLLQSLREKLKPAGSGEIYKHITRWPAAVYLTTNYDDEIQTNLANLGEAYIVYSNSEDHLSYLIPDLEGAIVKLHGDLRSDIGLILTATQFKEIAEGQAWSYWRTKMTSVFQMNRVIIIGYSLTDLNMRHVLQAARKGAGVIQPICWIAPDASREQIREYLENYRIRVISYDNKDGTHANLLRLIEHISDFVHPRQSIGIQEQIAKVSKSPLGENAAAPGFFVFNKLVGQSQYEEKRVEIIIAAMQSALPALSSKVEFSLKEAFELSGWPLDLSISLDFFEQVQERAIKEGLLIPHDKLFKVGSGAEAIALGNKNRFEHLRERFKRSLQLRVKRAFPALTDREALTISSDIEASLTGYFREGGLSLATTLFANPQSIKQTVAPSSIIKFINEASARYDSLLMRQAFSTVSVQAFVHATSPERDYLGRISQGFFAYHSLGVFGDVAIERLKEAKETVWLVDSNAQIPAIALAAPTNLVFVDCFSRLRDAGVRLFTTQRLFDETALHLRFANNVIKKYGPASSDVMAAAMGQSPYWKSNQFLEGFFRWQAAGNPCDWDSYLFQCFGEWNPAPIDIKVKLQCLGIEVLAFDEWPGFSEWEFSEVEQYVQRIVDIREGRLPGAEIEERAVLAPDDLHWQSDLYKKAIPEAEALTIIKHEREGQYYINSKSQHRSPAWFISNTSILNIIDKKSNAVTWQPDAFLRFASTLSKIADEPSSDRAFQTLLWACAQTGLTLLDEQTVIAAMGGIIDQVTLSISEQRQLYTDTLRDKYGESPEAVLARVSPINRPLAAIQLANEMAQEYDERRQQAEAAATAAVKRASIAEKELEKVERFRIKMETKKAQSRRNTRKQRAKQSSKRKKKRRVPPDSSHPCFFPRVRSFNLSGL